MEENMEVETPEEGSEGGVVDPADCGLLLLQEPGVERQPLAGRVLAGGGDGRLHAVRSP